MSGTDTITLNNRVFTDFADDNVGELTYPNEIAKIKIGKNGNAIYAFDTTGQACDFKMRLLRGGSDDKFLNGLLSLQQGNFPGFPLMIGQFVKKMGDGKGNIGSDIYVLSGGIFSKNVEAKSNVAGDVEQSVSIWMIKFANAPRAIT